MSTQLPVKQGISSAVVTSIPEQWSAAWFRRFITNYLQNGDVRNATAGSGIKINGGITTTATISLSSEVAALANEPYILAVSPTDTVLTDYRTIEPAAGLAVTDGGAKGNLTIGLAPQPSNTVLGSVSGGSVAPTALTTAQLTTLVNTFTSTLSGAVPASGGGTTNFLRADGSFTNQLTGSLGINGVTPPAQVTGWGTPTGGAPITNFPGGGPATLAQCSTAIAEIITALKNFGLFGA